jgi:hypothetical protein
VNVGKVSKVESIGNFMVERAHWRPKHDELVVRKEDGFLIMAVRMAEKLEREMTRAVEKTAGLIRPRSHAA